MAKWQVPGKKFCKTDYEVISGDQEEKYSLSRQIGIVSSSGTFANREVTSKVHIISLPCFVYDLAQSVIVNESSPVCWLVEIG